MRRTGREAEPGYLPFQAWVLTRIPRAAFEPLAARAFPPRPARRVAASNPWYSCVSTKVWRTRYIFDFPSYERNAVADVEVVTAGGAVPEQRANAFAAALLMPREGLRSELEQLGWNFGQPIDPHWLLHLQLMFRVSYTALGFRLLNLGWLGPDSWEQLSRVQPQVAAAVLGLNPYSALPLFQASSSGWAVSNTAHDLGAPGIPKPTGLTRSSGRIHGYGRCRRTPAHPGTADRPWVIGC